MTAGNMVSRHYDSLLVKVDTSPFTYPCHAAKLCRVSGYARDRDLDIMLGLQVIVKSSTFLSAVQKMQRALFEFYIRGVKTNIGEFDPPSSG